jgi:hypothetical protein
MNLFLNEPQAYGWRTPPNESAHYHILLSGTVAHARFKVTETKNQDHKSTPSGFTNMK